MQDLLKNLFHKMTAISSEQGYALLFLLSISIVFFYIFSSKNYKDKNDKYFLEDEEIKKAVKEEHWKQKTVTLVVIGSLTSLIYSNASHFFTLISVFGAAAAFAIREELSDIFAGLLMRSRMLKTAIYVGQTIMVPDKFGDSIFVVGQIKTFKTMLLDVKTSEYISIRNVSMIRESIKHIVINDLVTLNLNFIIDSMLDTKQLMYMIKKSIKKEFENKELYTQEIDYFKDHYAETKILYGAFPKVKNRCEFAFKYNTKLEIIMNIHLIFGNLSNLTKSEMENRFFHLIHKDIVKLTKTISMTKID